MNHDTAARLKAVFRKSGFSERSTIPRDALQDVLRRLDPTVRKDDLDVVFAAFGVTGSEAIRCDAFIDFVCCTSEDEKLRTATHTNLHRDPGVKIVSRKCDIACDDVQLLGLLVADVLFDAGWRSVDRQRINVQDRSGLGGSKTYQVSGWGKHVDPPIVALHLSVEATSDPISERRAKMAAALFREAGLAPRRLAEGGDWFMEAWEGNCLGEFWHLDDPEEDRASQHALPETILGANKQHCIDRQGVEWLFYPDVSILGCDRERKPRGTMTVEEAQQFCVGKEWCIGFGVGDQLLFKDAFGQFCPGDGLYLMRSRALQAAASMRSASVEELGALLANVHSLPTQWYDPLRAQLRSSHPSLHEVLDDSLLWFFTARWEHFIAPLSQLALRRWVQLLPSPASNAARRTVTCHADFHPGNIIYTDQGLKLVDYEFTCVMGAVHDLAWAFSLYITGVQKRRHFIRAYLEASQLPAGPDEVDELIADVHYCRYGIALGSLMKHIRKLNKDPQHDLSSFENYRALYLQARSSPQLSKHLAECSSFECFAEAQGFVIASDDEDAIHVSDDPGLGELGTDGEGSMFSLD